MITEKKVSTQFIAVMILLAAVILLVFHTIGAARDRSAKMAEAEELSKELAAITQGGGDTSSTDVLSEVEAKELASSIPVDLAQDTLILDINRIAKSADVSFNALTFSVNKLAAVPTVTISAGFQGAYQNLTRFLKLVETNPRKMIIKSASISRSTTDAGFELVNLNLTMESYFRGTAPIATSTGK